MLYHILPTNDHDKKLRYEQVDVYCYSKKQLDKRYGDGGSYRVVGETKTKNKKEEIAQLLLNKQNKPLVVCKPDLHNAILYKRAGYVHVGNDEYVALLKPRWPFLLLFFGLLTAAVILATMLMQQTEAGPVVINPGNPLPPRDPYVSPIEDDDTEKADVAEGGGSVSMIYTLEAKATLSSGEIGIYFKNPNASSHNVVVELYLLNGEDEVLVAQSGLVEPGFALDRLTLHSDAAVLTEGVYEGLYKVQCYDPVSGERALVAPQITGVSVSVYN